MERPMAMVAALHALCQAGNFVGQQRKMRREVGDLRLDTKCKRPVKPGVRSWAGSMSPRRATKLVRMRPI